jgi:hypothetical protein
MVEVVVVKTVARVGCKMATTVQEYYCFVS